MRFEDSWEAEPNTGCWLWIGNFYGVYGKCGGEGAHRVSYRYYVGPIPRWLRRRRALVLHKCDTPACVNPDHLFLGTQRDNMRDCVKKGRARKAVPKSERPLSPSDIELNALRAARQEKARAARVTKGSRS